MRIRWTEPAASDFLQICNYTKEQNGRPAARRVALQIYEAIASLAQFPHRGRPGRKPDTREMVISKLPFLAVYRVHDEVVEVIRIQHGAEVAIECVTSQRNSGERVLAG